MAGFLDAKERIIDMVLTGVGKNLLLQGELRFVYWIPFDDEVDYDPFISQSGSLSDEELVALRQTKIEEPLVREASSGYKMLNASEDDKTNVNRPMYTIPANQKVLPEVNIDGVPSGSVSVRTNQQKIQKFFVQKDSSGKDIVKTIGPIDFGVQRFGSDEINISLDYSLGSYPRDFDNEGFLVTVYHSGTDGFQEILLNRDSSGSIVYSNDMKLEILE